MRHAADVVGLVLAHGGFQLRQLLGGLLEEQVNQFADAVQVAVGQLVQTFHFHRRCFGDWCRCRFVFSNGIFFHELTVAEVVAA